MAKTIEEKRTAARERRRKLKEVKRPVTRSDGSTYLKSFYGATIEAAEAEWKKFVSPPVAPSGDELEELARRLPANSVPHFFITQYWPLKKHGRPNTIENLQHAARHLLPRLQDVMIWELTPAKLIEVLDDIAATKTHRNKGAKPKVVRRPGGGTETIYPKEIWKPLGASTVNRCRTIALEMNRLASRLNKRVALIDREWIPVRKERRRDVRIFEAPMMGVLIEECRGSVAFVPMILCGCLGMRINEAIGCRCEDLGADGVLRIRVQDDGYGNLTEDLKTEASARDLPLPAGMLAELRPFAFATGERLARGKDKLGKGGEPTVFGGRLRESNLNRAIGAKMRRIGVAPTTAHGLRHVVSTWLEHNGCPKSIRKAIMGHEPDSDTDRYNHATIEGMATWIDRMWTAFHAPPTKAVERAPETRRGTKTPARGDANGRAKLTWADIPRIRARLAAGETPGKIARSYDVDRTVIVQIRDGRTWKAA